jgi:hypothetical protein
MDATEQELNKKVNAVENEVGKAIDDQNKETIEGMAHHD